MSTRPGADPFGDQVGDGRLDLPRAQPEVVAQISLGGDAEGRRGAQRELADGIGLVDLALDLV